MLVTLEDKAVTKTDSLVHLRGLAFMVKVDQAEAEPTIAAAAAIFMFHVLRV